MNVTNCTTNVSMAGMGVDLCPDDEAYLSCPDPSLCELESGGNVGLAFGLTIGAGLATTLGAFLPFIPFIKRSNTRFLAIGLSLAAGVMIYVSFTEIWKKSRDNFCCVTLEHFDLAVTGCFFGGVLITILLDVLVMLLQRIDCGCSSHLCFKKRVRSTSLTSCLGCCRYCQERQHCEAAISVTNTIGLGLDENGKQNGLIPPSSELEDTSHDGASLGINNGSGIVPPTLELEQVSQDSQHFVADMASISVHSNTASDNTNNYTSVSVNELFSNSSLLRMNAIIPENRSLSMAGLEEEEDVDEGVESASHVSESSPGGDNEEGSEEGAQQDHQQPSYQEMQSETSSLEGEPLGPQEFKEVTEGLGKSTKKLHRMGILTGLAIGIHNFPEGLATFVAALSSPSLGAALAVAIALHNIPEGVCVALPVYYATGSKWKGFFWAFLSGISEPLGALLGWLVLKDVFSPAVYGVAFGLIAGMMVFISLKELLPTAYRFDSTKGKLVSVFLVVGMVIMALSLILFLY